MRALLLLLLLPTLGLGQTNISCANPQAEQVLLGNYNPADYTPSTVLQSPADIFPVLANAIDTDSLFSYLLTLRSFYNRNTGSDTVSNTMGIGAARRWAHRWFQELDTLREDRLEVSFLQFDEPVCGVGRHKNVFAVLPGVGPQSDEIVLVEGHFDSRCEDPCDSLCLAEGMEDNGSGSALVMELARTLSEFTFNRTLVFMLTTGEEQGLWGAKAFSYWAYNNGMDIVAVYNNDVIGGIICGETASAPGCPGLNDIDSTNVRIYSAGNFNSQHKSLARFVKLEYQENIAPLTNLVNEIQIMTPEDRTGRGGDHMPFRSYGYPSVRFTSANEHGHGGPDSTYHDRQHTEEDVLGLDTTGDGIPDTLFVDLNYLARNALINANAMASSAMGPVPVVDFTVTAMPGALVVQIDDTVGYGEYRVGVRSLGNDWDSLYTIYTTHDTLWGLDILTSYRVSCATVDSVGIESHFWWEKASIITTADLMEQELPSGFPVVLLQNHPNPFDEMTTICVDVLRPFSYKSAQIVIRNVNGQEVDRLDINLDKEVNETLFTHGFRTTGVYSYSLLIDGVTVDTKQMIFAY